MSRPSAPRTPGRVADVESRPCPGGGTHRLANSSQRGGLVTACVGCRASWAEIDAAAREVAS